MTLSMRSLAFITFLLFAAIVLILFSVSHGQHYLESVCEKNPCQRFSSEVFSEPDLWIVDTDVGADDGVAISLSLGLEELRNDTKIIGITTVLGNTNVDNVARNVLKILKTTNRLDIPVYKGANQSLLITPPNDNFFGEDGFGDFPFPDPPSEDLLQNGHAVTFLTEIVRKNPGKINILAIGPLTNIAMAIRFDPTFLKNIQRMVILGGSVAGIGNIKPGVEFNIYIDPEAAFIVFDEAEKVRADLQLVSWDAAVPLKISKTWRMMVLGAIDNPIIQLLNNAENITEDDGEDWISSDTIAASIAFNGIFYSETKHFGQVETCGSFTKGATLIDYNDREEKNRQIRVVTPGSISKTEFQDFLVNTFQSLARLNCFSKLNCSKNSSSFSSPFYRL